MSHIHLSNMPQVPRWDCSLPVTFFSESQCCCASARDSSGICLISFCLCRRELVGNQLLLCVILTWRPNRWNSSIKMFRWFLWRLQCSFIFLTSPVISDGITEFSNFFHNYSDILAQDEFANGRIVGSVRDWALGKQNKFVTCTI